MENRGYSGNENELRKRAESNGSLNTPSESPTVVEQYVAMKKEVGLVSGVALIAGTMIGSGIFISPVGVLNATGSVGSSLLVWAGCGILAMFGALCYAELGTMITKSGGEFVYIGEALGTIPAFLFAWTSVIVIRTSSIAIICLSFAQYVVTPLFDECGPPTIVIKLLAAVAILTIAIVNCYSVVLAARVQVFFTVLKIAALAVIIIGGLVMIGKGNTQYLQNGFEGSKTNPSGIALAFYDGLWAYDGWNNLNYAVEELKHPEKNLPRSILIGLPLVTILYILTNISYFSVMSKADMLASSAVAVTWGERVLGSVAVVIPFAVACSTFGAANGTCFTGGRLCYVAAREGHLPGLLSFVHVKKLTPIPSLVFTTIISVLMIIPGDISSLIDFFSFTAWLFYGATVLSLIIMRFHPRTKDWDRPYKVPLPIPIIVFLASIYLVIAPIVDSPKIEFLYAALFVVGGLIFYFPFVFFKLRLKCMEKVTMAVQLYMEVAPSKYEPSS
ncbi:LOW QUALITY PROTEIN: b(0,+)-type amino acid transporter 1-like [Liolophura sinensis]|uniref:LOW QUALITY PROTEIN: b(0,+)-type amino acid transporter 1-like n=1 Tax=Liolophura sinensis TaxID=3198878 RepID=UPI003158C5E5